MSPRKKDAPPLSIVMAAMEMVPVVKVGGLADVVPALAAELARRGHDVTVILPRYRDLADGPWRLETLPNAEIEVRLGKEVRRQRFLRLRLRDFPVRVFLLDDPAFSERGGIYVDPETRTDFPDNADRYAAFCLGVLALLERVDLAPDLLHVHDFQTALLPSLLRRRPEPYFDATRTLLTIHNLAFQGVYDPGILGRVGLDHAGFHPGGPFEFWGKTNLLKAGILDADAVTTVSPTYAKEIMTDVAQGHGLTGVLAARGDLVGIRNGIDTGVWNPARDPHLPRSYSPGDPAGKEASRRALRERTGLRVDPGRPLVGMVSRVTEQKGIHLLEDGWPALAALDLGLVVLGSGDPALEALLAGLARAHPGRVFYSPGFDDPLAHLIQGGADILLVPSRFEPCGLTQMIAMAYGTVPVVHRVGGLADTVRPVEEDPRRGTGFGFTEYAPGPMAAAVARAVRHYEDRASWGKIMTRGMKEDVSWSGPAADYEAVFRGIARPASRPGAGAAAPERNAR